MKVRLRPATLTRLCCAAVLIAHPFVLLAQGDPTRRRHTPVELQATDREIRAALEEARGDADNGDIDAAIEKTKKACGAAVENKLLGDEAICEARLASNYIAKGRFDDGLKLLQKALQEAVDSGNLVLEADILTSLSSEAEVQGDWLRASEIVRRAVSRAEEAQNLFEKSRALGELGRLQLLVGKTEEGGISIGKALEIDRLNDYELMASHLVFQGYFLISTEKLDAAVDCLNEAIGKAIELSDMFSFVLANNALAVAHIRKQEASNAIQILESIRKGDLGESNSSPEIRRRLLAALAAPFPRVSVLEGLGTAYEMAGQPEGALPVWSELYSFSDSIGLVVTKAESAKKMADLNAQLKRTSEALRLYAVAVPLLRELKNEPMLLQALIAETLLLVQAGRGAEALPLTREIVELAKRRKMRPLEFSAYLEIAQIYQPSGDLDNARTALEKAQALVEPGPGDKEIDNKQLLEAYNRLGDIYREQQIPSSELLEAEKGIVVARLLKDDKAEANLVSYIRRRFSELKIYEMAKKNESEGKLSDALILSEIIVVFDGVPNKPGDDMSSWNRVLNLPFQLVQRQEGPAVLQQIVKEMGPFLGNPKYAILDALCRHYLGAGARPDQAEQFAKQFEAAAKDTGDSLLFLKAAAACDLTMAYANQGKGELAKAKVPECLALAEKTNQQETKDFANAANVMAHVAANDLGEAEASLNELIGKVPNNSELQVTLACALASRQKYKKSEAALKKATEVYLASADKKAAATAYLRVAAALGGDNSEDGKKEQWKCFEAAEQLFQETSDLANQSSVEVAMGERFLGKENHRAQEHFHRALALAEEARRDDLSALVQADLGIVHYSFGEFSKAAEYHQKAAATYHRIQNSSLEALALAGLGRDELALHELDKALLHLLEAKSTAAGGATTRYLIELNLGELYKQEGEFEKALTAFRECEEVTKEGQDLDHLAYSHLAVGGLDELFGYWEESVNKAQEALALFKKTRNREGESAAYAELVNIYGDRTSSVKNFEKALTYYKEAERLGYGPRLQLDLLEVYLQTHQFSQAIRSAQEGLKACVKEHDSDCQAHALLSMAEAKRNSTDLKGARSDMTEAKELATEAKDTYLQGRLLYGEARQERAEGHLDVALTRYTQLISLIETVKNQGDSHTQRGLAENYAFIYDELTSTLHALYELKISAKERFQLATKALEFAETNKARQFATSWGRVFINEMRRELPAEVQEKEHFLLAKRAQLQLTMGEYEQSATSESRSKLKQLTEELSSINRDFSAFVANERQTNPQYAAVAYPEPTSIEKLPLRKGETLIEYKVTEDSTFIWVIRNVSGVGNELRGFYEINKPRAWFVERTSSLRAALNSGDPSKFDPRMSEELFHALFPERAAKEVLESNGLIFVPDDVLFLLPFELLSPHASMSDFVLLKVPTRYYPSAATLILGRAGKHDTNWQEAFLGIGDPITSPQDQRYSLARVLPSEGPTAADARSGVPPTLVEIDLARIRSRGYSFDRLRGTAQEVRSIGALFQSAHESSEVRLGSDATKDRILNTDLSRFRFLHFATHGILPVDTDISEPSLVLSYDGTEPERMFLSMSEILALHVRADTVVLSACNTGTGNVSRAEGVMSLGRAFLAAGASSVTVSLWQVSDESTALFMVEFYRNVLEGKHKDVALASARASLFERGYRQPFFWAPFVVIGE
jgi:CHAT domain-containing protein/tetratricopeptide (TPR) repeat protein